MKKALFLTICISVLALCSAFAAINNPFETGTDTTSNSNWNMSIAWDGNSGHATPGGTIAASIVSGGNSGNCLQLVTVSTVDNTQVNINFDKAGANTSLEPWTPSVDTVAECWTYQDSAWHWTQIFIQPDWTWTSAGDNSQVAWQHWVKSFSGATLPQAGLMIYYGTAGTYTAKIDDFKISSGITPVSDWTLMAK